MADAPPPLLTIPEAAEYLRAGIRTVARYVADEELPSVKIGRLRRIRREDLEEFVSKRSTEEVA